MLWTLLAALTLTVGMALVAWTAAWVAWFFTRHWFARGSALKSDDILSQNIDLQQLMAPADTVALHAAAGAWTGSAMHLALTLPLATVQTSAAAGGFLLSYWKLTVIAVLVASTGGATTVLVRGGMESFDGVYNGILGPFLAGIKWLANLLRLLFDTFVPLYNATAYLILKVPQKTAQSFAGCIMAPLGHAALATGRSLFELVKELMAWIGGDVTFRPLNLVPSTRELLQWGTGTREALACFCGDLVPLFNLTFAPLMFEATPYWVSNATNIPLSLVTVAANATGGIGGAGAARPDFDIFFDTLRHTTLLTSEIGMRWINAAATLVLSAVTPGSPVVTEEACAPEGPRCIDGVRWYIPRVRWIVATKPDMSAAEWAALDSLSKIKSFATGAEVYQAPVSSALVAIETARVVTRALINIDRLVVDIGTDAPGASAARAALWDASPVFEALDMLYTDIAHALLWLLDWDAIPAPLKYWPLFLKHVFFPFGLLWNGLWQFLYTVSVNLLVGTVQAAQGQISFWTVLHAMEPQFNELVLARAKAACADLVLVTGGGDGPVGCAAQGACMLAVDGVDTLFHVANWVLLGASPCVVPAPPGYDDAYVTRASCFQANDATRMADAFFARWASLGNCVRDSFAYFYYLVPGSAPAVQDCMARKDTNETLRAWVFELAPEPQTGGIKYDPDEPAFMEPLPVMDPAPPTGEIGFWNTRCKNATVCFSQTCREDYVKWRDLFLLAEDAGGKCTPDPRCEPRYGSCNATACDGGCMECQNGAGVLHCMAPSGYATAQTSRQCSFLGQRCWQGFAGAANFHPSLGRHYVCANSPSSPATDGGTPMRACEPDMAAGKLCWTPSDAFRAAALQPPAHETCYVPGDVIQPDAEPTRTFQCADMPTPTCEPDASVGKFCWSEDAARCACSDHAVEYDKCRVTSAFVRAFLDSQRAGATGNPACPTGADAYGVPTYAPSPARAAFGGASPLFAFDETPPGGVGWTYSFADASVVRAWQVACNDASINSTGTLPRCGAYVPNVPPQQQVWARPVIAGRASSHLRAYTPRFCYMRGSIGETVRANARRSCEAYAVCATRRCTNTAVALANAGCDIGASAQAAWETIGATLASLWDTIIGTVQQSVFGAKLQFVWPYQGVASVTCSVKQIGGELLGTVFALTLDMLKSIAGVAGLQLDDTQTRGAVGFTAGLAYQIYLTVPLAVDTSMQIVRITLQTFTTISDVASFFEGLAELPFKMFLVALDRTVLLARGVTLGLYKLVEFLVTGGVGCSRDTWPPIVRNQCKAEPYSPCGGEGYSSVCVQDNTFCLPPTPYSGGRYRCAVKSWCANEGDVLDNANSYWRLPGEKVDAPGTAWRARQASCVYAASCYAPGTSCATLNGMELLCANLSIGTCHGLCWHSRFVLTGDGAAADTPRLITDAADLRCRVYGQVLPFATLRVPNFRSSSLWTGACAAGVDCVTGSYDADCSLEQGLGVNVTGACAGYPPCKRPFAAQVPSDSALAAGGTATLAPRAEPDVEGSGTCSRIARGTSGVLDYFVYPSWEQSRYSDIGWFHNYSTSGVPVTEDAAIRTADVSVGAQSANIQAPAPAFASSVTRTVQFCHDDNTGEVTANCDPALVTTTLRCACGDTFVGAWPGGSGATPNPDPARTDAWCRIDTYELQQWYRGVPGGACPAELSAGWGTPDQIVHAHDGAFLYSVDFTYRFVQHVPECTYYYGYPYVTRESCRLPARWSVSITAEPSASPVLTLVHADAAGNVWRAGALITVAAGAVTGMSADLTFRVVLDAAPNHACRAQFSRSESLGVASRNWIVLVDLTAYGSGLTPLGEAFYTTKCDTLAPFTRDTLLEIRMGSYTDYYRPSLQAVEATGSISACAFLTAPCFAAWSPTGAAPWYEPNATEAFRTSQCACGDAFVGEWTDTTQSEPGGGGHVWCATAWTAVETWMLGNGGYCPQDMSNLLYTHSGAWVYKTSDAAEYAALAVQCSHPDPSSHEAPAQADCNAPFFDANAEVPAGQFVCPGPHNFGGSSHASLQRSEVRAAMAGRTYLPQWGLSLNDPSWSTKLGGCCHASANDAPAWNRLFALQVRWNGSIVEAEPDCTNGGSGIPPVSAWADNTTASARGIYAPLTAAALFSAFSPETARAFYVYGHFTSDADASISWRTPDCEDTRIPRYNDRAASVAVPRGVAPMICGMYSYPRNGVGATSEAQAAGSAADNDYACVADASKGEFCWTPAYIAADGSPDGRTRTLGNEGQPQPDCADAQIWQRAQGMWFDRRCFAPGALMRRYDPSPCACGDVLVGVRPDIDATPNTLFCAVRYTYFNFWAAGVADGAYRWCPAELSPSVPTSGTRLVTYAADIGQYVYRTGADAELVEAYMALCATPPPSCTDDNTLYRCKHASQTERECASPTRLCWEADAEALGDRDWPLVPLDTPVSTLETVAPASNVARCTLGTACDTIGDTCFVIEVHWTCPGAPEPLVTTLDLVPLRWICADSARSETRIVFAFEDPAPQLVGAGGAFDCITDGVTTLCTSTAAEGDYRACMRRNRTNFVDPGTGNKDADCTAPWDTPTLGCWFSTADPLDADCSAVAPKDGGCCCEMQSCQGNVEFAARCPHCTLYSLQKMLIVLGDVLESALQIVYYLTKIVVDLLGLAFAGGDNAEMFGAQLLNDLERMWAELSSFFLETIKAMWDVFARSPLGAVVQRFFNDVYCLILDAINAIMQFATSICGWGETICMKLVELKNLSVYGVKPFTSLFRGLSKETCNFCPARMEPTETCTTERKEYDAPGLLVGTVSMCNTDEQGAAGACGASKTCLYSSGGFGVYCGAMSSDTNAQSDVSCDTFDLQARCNTQAFACMCGNVDGTPVGTCASASLDHCAGVSAGLIDEQDCYYSYSLRGEESYMRVRCSSCLPSTVWACGRSVATDTEQLCACYYYEPSFCSTEGGACVAWDVAVPESNGNCLWAMEDAPAYSIANGSLWLGGCIQDHCATGLCISSSANPFGKSPICACRCPSRAFCEAQFRPYDYTLRFPRSDQIMDPLPAAATTATRRRRSLLRALLQLEGNASAASVAPTSPAFSPDTVRWALLNPHYAAVPYAGDWTLAPAPTVDILRDPWLTAFRLHENQNATQHAFEQASACESDIDCNAIDPPALCANDQTLAGFSMCDSCPTRFMAGKRLRFCNATTSTCQCTDAAAAMSYYDLADTPDLAAVAQSMPWAGKSFCDVAMADFSGARARAPATSVEKAQYRSCVASRLTSIGIAHVTGLSLPLSLFYNLETAATYALDTVRIAVSIVRQYMYDTPREEVLVQLRETGVDPMHYSDMVRVGNMIAETVRQTNIAAIRTAVMSVHPRGDTTARLQAATVQFLDSLGTASTTIADVAPSVMAAFPNMLAVANNVSLAYANATAANATATNATPASDALALALYNNTAPNATAQPTRRRARVLLWAIGSGANAGCSVIDVLLQEVLYTFGTVRDYYETNFPYSVSAFTAFATNPTAPAGPALPEKTGTARGTNTSSCGPYRTRADVRSVWDGLLYALQWIGIPACEVVNWFVDTIALVKQRGVTDPSIKTRVNAGFGCTLDRMQSCEIRHGTAESTLQILALYTLFSLAVVVFLPFGSLVLSVLASGGIALLWWWTYGYSLSCYGLVPTCVFDELFAFVHNLTPAVLSWPAAFVERVVFYGPHRVTRFVRCENAPFRFTHATRGVAYALARWWPATASAALTGSGWENSLATAFAANPHITDFAALLARNATVADRIAAQHAEGCFWISSYYLVPPLLALGVGSAIAVRAALSVLFFAGAILKFMYASLRLFVAMYVSAPGLAIVRAQPPPRARGTDPQSKRD